MKRCFFVVMLCLILFTSCDLFKQFDDSDYQPLYGRLSIDFNAPQSKTVQPTSAMVTCAKYKISGKHTNGATFGPDTITAKSYTKDNIAVGDWQITVDGYNSSGVKIATSTKNVTITENVKTDVSFNLAYLTEGTGNYEVKFSIPSSNATLAKIECTLKSKKDSSTTTTTLTEFVTSGSKHIYTLSATNVNTGAYELKAIFKNADNDTITVFGPEIVQVYTDLTSTAEFFFDENLLHLERVITPVISPANGTYNNPITITITTATPEATIYYTTNGDIPTSKSNLYTGAFTLAENNTTVKAFAVKDHMEDSIVVSSSRFIFKVATPVLDPANGCSTPTSQKITITCDTVGATIRYTLDGSTPSKTNGIIYTEPFDLTSNTNAIKAVGYKDNMADSDICTSTAKYTIYVAKPVISMTDLSDGKKQVEVSCATAGASIQYKIDSGSWINYTTPLEFSVPCTLYVQVSKTDMETNTASQVISWAKGDGAFAISSVPNYENLSVVEPDGWTGQISNLSKATVKTKWNNAGTSSTSYTWYLDGDIISGANSDSVSFEDVSLTNGSHVLMVHSVYEGRSANCGECAQICRTWFTTENKPEEQLWCFSMKDLCLGTKIKRYAEIGIDSLKIEGRMKGPEYVYNTARYYSSILNGDSDEQIDILKDNMLTTFSRHTTEGFFNSFYMGSCNTKSMVCTDYPSHVGLKVGTIKKVMRDTALVHFEKPVAQRDGLLVLYRKQNVGFPLSHTESGKSFVSANSIETINFPSAKFTDIPQTGVPVYCTSRHNRNLELLNENIPLYKKKVNLEIEISDTGLKVNHSEFPAEVQEARTATQIQESLVQIFSASDKSYFSSGSLSLKNKSSYKNPFIPLSVLKQIRREFYRTLDEEFENNIIQPEKPALDIQYCKPDNCFIFEPLEFVKQVVPEDKYTIVLNNVSQIAYAKEHPQNKYFLGYFLYAQNTWAYNLLNNEIPNLCGIAQIEDKNVPLFISRVCFRHHALGLPCVSCSKDNTFGIEQNGKHYKVICKNCITKVFSIS